MKKNKAKIILSVLLLSVLAVTLCACGSLDFTYIQNKDGTYSHIIDIRLTEDGLRELNYSVEGALAALKSGFEKQGYAVETSVENKRIVAQKNFNSIEEMEKDSLGNGLSVSGTSDDKGDIFIEKRDIFGIPKVSREYMAEEAVARAIKQAIISNGIFFTPTEDIYQAILKMNTSYTFVTPSKSVESDANTITETDNGYYAHTWTLDNVSNQKVRITISEIKGAIWYASAIIAAAVVTLITAVVKVISGKRAKAR